jgi:hypothetical protein
MLICSTLCTAKASFDTIIAMAKGQVKEVLDRKGELYHPDDHEWNAIDEGFVQAKRGDAVSADEIAGLLQPHGRRRPTGSGSIASVEKERWR